MVRTVCAPGVPIKDVAVAAVAAFVVADAAAS